MFFTIPVLIITTVATLTFVFSLLTSSEYDEMVEALGDDKNFPLKFLYGAGFKLLDKINFQYATKSALRLRREAVVLYGDKYGDYYLRAFYAQKISLSLAALSAMSMVGCMASSDSVLIMFGLSVVVAGAIYYYFTQQSLATIKKLSKTYVSEFPSIVSTMALLVNAGMVLRDAWDLVASGGDAEMHRQMQKATLDRNSGISEADALSAMARRCATPEISKFVSMVIQGLDKGSADLAHTLKNQSDEMWSLKQQKLLQEGEKASGKLIIPIMIMFIGVLLMIMIPILSGI